MDIRASKVVAGLEPEHTNMFLLALVECATDDSYDSNAAVRRCLAGEQPGDGPPALMKVIKILRHPRLYNECSGSKQNRAVKIFRLEASIKIG